MPELIKLYIRHSAIGFGVAALFVGLLLWFNVMNLRYLIAQDDAALLALFVLWFFNGVVFASVQFAYAVMRLAEKSEPPRQGGTGVFAYVRAAGGVRIKS